MSLVFQQRYLARRPASRPVAVIGAFQSFWAAGRPEIMTEVLRSPQGGASGLGGRSRSASRGPSLVGRRCAARPVAPYRGAVDRRDIGSWLSGPKIDQGVDGDVGYPGERLGLPPSGRGAVTDWGRRIAALVIDWFIVLGVSLAIVGPPEPGDDTFGLVNLAVLVVMYVLLLMTAGATLGMWLMGLGGLAGWSAAPVVRARRGSHGAVGAGHPGGGVRP